MKKKMKKRSFVALLMAFLMMSSSMSVLAATPETSSVKVSESRLVDSTTPDSLTDLPLGSVTSNNTTVTPRSIYGYAACDTHAAYGSFTVTAPGTASSTGGFTIQTAYFTDGTPIYISIKRPDGSYAVKDVPLSGNVEKVLSYKNAQPGTLTCYYSIYGSSRGQIRLWAY